MACVSCGSPPPAAPLFREGLPTVWAWLRPTPDLIAVPTFEALAVIDRLNGDPV